MYVDTSVAVKLYVMEPDSEVCEATVAGRTLVSSSLLLCEFRSALLGKVSRGVITREIEGEILDEFERDVAARKIVLVTMDDLVIRNAADLLDELHPGVPLRTLDAIHLATYLDVEAGPLFTKDLRMLQAAARLGLPTAG
jgi:predicted nucleic acid-binding protein